MSSSREVAGVLLDIGAVGFKPSEPITFKSGIKSPVYVDNRTLPFHPEKWRVVLSGLSQLIDENQIEFDVIAGIETAGVVTLELISVLLHFYPSTFSHASESRSRGSRSPPNIALHAILDSLASLVAPIEAPASRLRCYGMLHRTLT